MKVRLSERVQVLSGRLGKAFDSLQRLQTRSSFTLRHETKERDQAHEFKVSKPLGWCWGLGFETPAFQCTARICLLGPRVSRLKVLDGMGFILWD